MIIKNGIVADPASGLYEQMDILEIGRAHV